MYERFPTARPNKTVCWIKHPGLPVGLVVHTANVGLFPMPRGKKGPSTFVWAHPLTLSKKQNHDWLAHASRNYVNQDRVVVMEYVLDDLDDAPLRRMDHDEYSENLRALFGGKRRVRQLASLRYAAEAIHPVDISVATLVLRMNYPEGLSPEASRAIVAMFEAVPA